MSAPGVVLVTTSFPLAGDGSEAAGSFVDDLAREIGRERPVRVVAPGPVSREEAWAPGVQVFRYAAPARPLSTLKLWHPRDLAAIAGVLRSGAAATRAAVAAAPTARIAALWALPSGEWARRAARRAGLPYSVWTLGSDIWTLGKIPGLRSLLAAVLRDAAHCYSDGIALAEDTRRIAGRDVEFLPSTRRIDARRETPLRTEAPYRLLFLGRWHPNKGVDLMLDALQQLDEADWQRIEAVEVCGGGPLDAQVRSGVAALQAAGRPVQLHGYLDKPAAQGAFLRADYLLLASRIESIPVVFSDAMKLSCAVLAMPVGDLPALLAEGGGVAAPAVTAPAYAQLIRAALQRSAAEFGPGMAAHAARFDLAAVAARLTEAAPA